MSVEDVLQEPIVRVTDSAFKKVVEIRSEEPNPDELALWLEISGTQDGAYTYDMYFQAVSEAGPDHAVQRHDDLSLVIPQGDVERMRGATLDMNPDPIMGGMVIKNPNRPEEPASPQMGRAPADLTGDVAQRVIRVLDEQINPAIASHGGHAELVAVEDDAAYLRLSGGCAGCGMAGVTLSQGIEVALRESVPEITRVVDVTDHASGTNPYYEATKK